MRKLTNLYYSQYASSTESEPMYNSDNADTYEKLIRSPSQAEYVQYINHRKDEESHYELWKQMLCEHSHISLKIKKQCGMTAVLTDDRVRYIYKPDSNNSHIPGIKFKITFIYIKLLRKWYISLGRSRVPNVINLRNKVREGTYNPIGTKILKLVHKCKSLLEIYVQKLLYIYEVIDEMKDVYKDLEFEVNEPLTILKIKLKEKGWPRGLEKISSEDVVLLELILDDNLKVVNLTYEYICKSAVPEEVKEMCITKLEEKLKEFFNFNLKEAFDIFMKEEKSYETKNYL